ncbi:hypothetical protein H632_c91p3 [Helicosporidium sp. ATCC 50920]|nr:hypothetical protein H632_c91p3 [Helicosporidium sp. ATCC 50920]|eukprot:KDD76837.1 hypothetical protein H632_c91p3 [Helicosporidium sp. ATCC 50920]
MKKSLYDILGVAKNASQADVRKAYLKLALKLHPDKNPDGGSHEDFQALQKVYGVLSDETKRERYDRTGIVEEEDGLAGKDFDELYSHYRSLYAKVTEDDIDAFSASYRGSEEEAKDLLELYVKHKGDMDAVLAWVMCSDASVDSHRFADTIEAAVAAGQAPAFSRFQSWAKRVRRKAAPKDPLRPPLRKKNGNSKSGEDSLALMIRSRQQTAHGSMVDALAAKYGVSGGDEPSEEAFAAARQRHEARVKSKGAAEGRRSAKGGVQKKRGAGAKA